MVKAKDTDGALKRLGGGRWQTRDDRFTIEPQSGTWVVVDAEQVDDLGLPLIRGPFGSLGAAKAAIATAREAAPAVSPLAAKVAEHRERPARARESTREPSTEQVPVRTERATGTARGPKPKPVAAPEPAPPALPKWLTDLAPADRRRARELIARLETSGASDAEGIARRDIAGGVPATAAFALARAISALGPGASAEEVARLVAAGQDAALGVSWRIVDDDGRPITLVLPRPSGR